MKQFEFYTVESTQDRTFVINWHWRSDGTRTSTEGFDTFDRCVADASQNGFKAEELPADTYPLDLICSGIDRSLRKRRLIHSA